MQRLLCEPEDRLGSIAAPTRPNSHLVQERRSGFAQLPTVGLPKDDGASQIKVSQAQQCRPQSALTDVPPLHSATRGSRASTGRVHLLLSA